MPPFDKEMEVLREQRKGKEKDSPEYIRSMQRITELFLNLIKILKEKDDIKE